jgi:hypothetical protein
MCSFFVLPGFVKIVGGEGVHVHSCLAESVFDLLRPFRSVFADANFFDNTRGLGDNGFFGHFVDFQRLVLQRVEFSGRDATVYLVALNRCVFFFQDDLFFNRCLHQPAKYPDGATLHLTFADVQKFFDDGNDSLAPHRSRNCQWFGLRNRRRPLIDLMSMMFEDLFCLLDYPVRGTNHDQQPAAL